jgi:hypothetical protein
MKHAEVAFNPRSCQCAILLFLHPRGSGDRLDRAAAERKISMDWWSILIGVGAFYVVVSFEMKISRLKRRVEALEAELLEYRPH